MRIFLKLLMLSLCPFSLNLELRGQELFLDGQWEVGEERIYHRDGLVPGLAQDPGQVSPGTLWYRRTVTLPAGDWTRASLTLKGARFAPVIYIDGAQVSSAEGGMAPTVHALNSPAIAPSRTVTLEIALKSLSDLDPLDASATPKADRWRTNISSGLWDSVVLHCSGETRIARMTPWTDFVHRTVDVHWSLDSSAPAASDRTAKVMLLDAKGKVVAQSARVPADACTVHINVGESCEQWSPDSPNLYRLNLTVYEGEKVADQREIAWGLREFTTDGLGFILNGKPVHLRAGTVVWPRFLRDPDARVLAFDVAWFERNVVDRLCGLGANTLRFHLGLPPDALLDLCDRRGLMVQLEWPFFHGIDASPASLRVQWRSWLDVAMRHPSVVLLHPWNETEGEQLAKANAAIADLCQEYPPLVISHRDVLHIHKYWWSLFENLGLYYESASDFPKPIMVDEFGGNYLDRNGDEGSYPTVHEAYLRFLGRDSNRELRLQHHAESNALVAEYWRRLGAAGFSPFCIFGSPQDGNDWFLGSLANPDPKPVWAALAAALSPQSVSLEMWNRNYSPRQKVELPLIFFNDCSEATTLGAAVRLVGSDEKVVSEQIVSASVPDFGTARSKAYVEMPEQPGQWRLEAELLNKVAGVTVPIKSTWRCRTLRVVVPDALKTINFGVPADEAELRSLLSNHGLHVSSEDDPAARLLIFSAKSWGAISGSATLQSQLDSAITRGQSVVMLDVGPTDLERYQESARKNLQGAPVLSDAKADSHKLFAGIEVIFREAAEPESHLHPAANNDALWRNLPRDAAWLWNGLRGGLVVPAYAMDVAGLSSSAFLALWGERGANLSKLKEGAPSFAYELSGYYEFSERADDKGAIERLRSRVQFLVADAPSLQGRINPAGPVAVTDLAATLKSVSQFASASELTPLASCGKNLTRIPVVMVGFGAGRGKVILSQLLTQGRLVAKNGTATTFEPDHDPATEQLVLNLFELAISP